MSAQDIILGARVAHVRELKTALAKEKAENAALRDELSAIRAHFDMALLAAQDLRDGHKLIIFDGWNLILSAQRIASDKAELVRLAAREAEEKHAKAWIVFDGPRENVQEEQGVRISYTGGTGSQRADTFIADFVRMARYEGLSANLEIRTTDKALLQRIHKT